MQIHRQLLFARRISYLTDVEGDMNYFQQFISLTSCVRWGWKKNALHCSGETEGNDPGIAPTQPRTSSRAFISPTEESRFAKDKYLNANYATPTLLDLRHIGLDFVDDETLFVYGGDAFDNGFDLSFAQACIDFKKRYPDRVHLILGNRDLNKMAMVPLIYEVETMTAEKAERLVFPPERTPGENSPTSVSYAQFLCNQESNTSVLAKSKGFGKETLNTDPMSSVTMRCASYSQPKQGSKQHLKADRISFLQWALVHKMGSPHAFEHRRRELAKLKKMQAFGANEDIEDQSFGALQVMLARRSVDVTSREAKTLVTDSEVAESFFSAARPNGVYYEFIRLGVIAAVLFNSVLFVHGGINANNVGFVPNIHAITSESQQKQGRNFLTEGRDALEWVSALNEFKNASFDEWSSYSGLRGEAARLYVYPRQYIPFSVTVGSIMQTNGPQYLDLKTTHYLLSSGIEIVCAGHQPTGDTPALVRQPGGLLVLGADNSYCGRGNEYCSLDNQRGCGVVEVLIHTESYSNKATRKEEDTITANKLTVQIHGRRADGTLFDFVANTPEESLLGRALGEGWWVKVPLDAHCKPQLVLNSHVEGAESIKSEDGDDFISLQASFYELHRTVDGFRSEEIRVVSREEAKQMLEKYHTQQFSPQPGSLLSKYTANDLAPRRKARMKTRVRRSSTVVSE